ncbi:MAG: relaxase/mobilization nuclease domain-containing protein [Pyramidobacter sp.]|nr:relaxase/mobilization nuclease domain-containing protein [Pyramidobacter sp.]
MIIKEPPKTRDGKSDVGRLIRYMETAQESKGQVSDDERVLYSGTINMACDEMTAEMRPARIAEMKLWAKQNNYCKNPIHHRILSFREGENPTEEQCREAVQIFLETCGLEECQCVWATHKDTHCTHIHVCVNRIHPMDKHAVHIEYSKTKEQIAARKIEVAQGWEIEQTGTLAKVVEKDGQWVVEATTIKERREKNDVNKVISQVAQEHEYRTGEKSTERIIKERAANVLYAAIKKGSKRTWADVHAQLAELGMEIKPWKSGGVVVAEGVSVTCSKIGRQLAWGNLINALGEYQERDPELEIKTVKKEIIAANDDDRKRKEEYSAARRKYYTDKSAAYDKFNAWRISTPRRLKEEHQQRRKELRESRQSWIGHGPELNALTHQLAARYAQEMAEYRAERDRRRKRLKELYGKKWPTYQGWQRGEWDDPSAMIIGVTINVEIEIKPIAIAQFTSQVYVSGKKSYVVYRDNHQRVAFVDRGNFIPVYTWRTDPQAMLASLQLAVAKWGKFRLNGCDEYKQKALAVAVEHGFIVTNPELQAQIKKLQAEKAAREATERAKQERERQQQEELLRRQKMPFYDLQVEIDKAYKSYYEKHKAGDSSSYDDYKRAWNLATIFYKNCRQSNLGEVQILNHENVFNSVKALIYNGVICANAEEFTAGICAVTLRGYLDTAQQYIFWDSAMKKYYCIANDDIVFEAHIRRHDHCLLGWSGLSSEKKFVTEIPQWKKEVVRSRDLQERKDRGLER